MSIDPSSKIDSSVEIADNVTIGPWCIIGANVSIGESSVLDSHVVIRTNTKLGKGNRIFQFSSVGEDPADKKFEGEETYRLSLWIKNDGTKFNISGGGVSAFESDMITLIEDDEQISEWRLLNFEIDVQKEKWLRMQLNILKPGTFWIDDIRIEKI